MLIDVQLTSGTNDIVLATRHAHESRRPYRRCAAPRRRSLLDISSTLLELDPTLLELYAREVRQRRRARMPSGHDRARLQQAALASD